MKGEPPRIALFGGTFDPVHIGHVRMAQEAKDSLALDRVIMIPCKLSPHKTNGPSPASGECRMEMIRLVCEDHPWMEADACELTREGVSYSWQTARMFRDRHPDARLFWIMGEDQWLALPRWSEPERLAAMVEFIVFARNERNPLPREGMRAHFLPGVHQASASQIRAGLRSRRVPGDARDWICPRVLDFISERRLYGVVRSD